MKTAVAERVRQKGSHSTAGKKPPPPGEEHKPAWSTSRLSTRGTRYLLAPLLDEPLFWILLVIQLLLRV